MPDYTLIATRYNQLEPGRVMDLDKVSNVTNFKQALQRRGIKAGEDFALSQPKRSERLLIRRLSERRMRYRPISLKNRSRLK